MKEAFCNIILIRINTINRKKIFDPKSDIYKKYANF